MSNDLTLETKEGELYVKLELDHNKALMIEILDYTIEGGEDEKYLAPLAYGFINLIEQNIETVYKAGVEDMIQQVEMGQSSAIH